MQRLIICALAVLSLNSFGAAGSVSLLTEALPSFISVVRSPKYPEISVRCIEDRTVSGSFWKHDTARLLCVIAGHANPHIRKQMLDGVENVSETVWRNHYLEGGEGALESIRSAALQSLTMKELLHPTQLSLITLAIKCSSKPSSWPNINLSMLDNQVEYASDEVVPRDSFARYDAANFEKGEFTRELLRRERSGECAKSVMTDAFKQWVEGNNSIGFEIDCKALHAYFEQRNSRFGHSR